MTTNKAHKHTQSLTKTEQSSAKSQKKNEPKKNK